MTMNALMNRFTERRCGGSVVAYGANQTSNRGWKNVVIYGPAALVRQG